VTAISPSQKREVRKRSADEASGRLEDGDDDDEDGGRGGKADKRKAKQEAKNEKRARKKQEVSVGDSWHDTHPDG
jgi:hypothetical protein